MPSLARRKRPHLTSSKLPQLLLMSALLFLILWGGKNFSRELAALFSPQSPSLDPVAQTKPSPENPGAASARLLKQSSQYLLAIFQNSLTLRQKPNDASATPAANTPSENAPTP